MNYNQTLEFLFSSLVSYQEKGPEAYKPGLERITAFCKHLGNPQRNYFTIHVAGTNGKGSVSHMLASVLQQAGYRTGLYTSPHLRDFRERILVDGEMIPKQKVVNFVDKHYDCMKELGLSFFEMSTALAFDYFDQSDVEVAVIETGLGGRLDATNLIIPIVSVITNIGLDHMALLGDTLPKIAAEKAGIIKKSIPVVIGEKSDEYNHVFDQAATAMMSKIVYAENDFACINHSTEGDFQKFSIQRHRDNKVFNLELDLTGNYQVHNILTAIAVIDLLHQETPLTISLRALTEGMRTVASGTALQGGGRSSATNLSRSAIRDTTPTASATLRNSWPQPPTATSTAYWDSSMTKTYRAYCLCFPKRPVISSRSPATNGRFRPASWLKKRLHTVFGAKWPTR